MEFAEKYNLILDMVNKNCDKSMDEILDILEDKLATNKRQITDTFSFFTGETFNSFYKKMKLKKIYDYKQSQNISFDKATEEYDMDVATFSRSFKQNFGASPTQVDEKVLYDAVKQYSLSEIINGEKDKGKMEKSIFGIPETKYRALLEIIDYQSAYGFNEGQAECAYALSKKYNASMADAFEFVDQCECGNYHAKSFIVKGDDEWRNYKNKACAFLFFNYGLSIPRAFDEIEILSANGVENLFDEPKEVIDAFFDDVNGEHDYFFYKDLYEILKKKGKANWFEYYCQECPFEDTPEECLEINDSLKEFYEKELENKDFIKLSEEYDHNFDDVEIEESFHKGTWEDPDDEESRQDTYDYLCYSD